MSETPNKYIHWISISKFKIIDIKYQKRSW
jgi:hypothetical protein